MISEVEQKSANAARFLDYIENDLGKKQYVQALRERESTARRYLGAMAIGAVSIGGAAFMVTTGLPLWATGLATISGATVGLYLGHRVVAADYEEAKEKPERIRSEMHRVGRQVEAIYAAADLRGSQEPEMSSDKARSYRDRVALSNCALTLNR